MIRIAAAVVGFACVVGAAFQEPAGGKAEDARRAAVSAMEKSMAQGGVVLSGRVKVKPPEAEGMTFEISDPNAGPNVEGEFTARVGRDGAGSVVLEKKDFRYELFQRGDRRAQRLSWTSKGVPVTGDVGGDLHRLLQWDHLLKQVEKAKKAESRPDVEIDGTACRVVTFPITPEFLEETQKVKPSEPPPLEVSTIQVTMQIDKGTGWIKSMAFDVSRKMNLAFGGGDQEILVTNIYSFTVGKFDSALKVEIPPDVEKLLR